MAGWNPWHGCKKISEGCQHCYVYRMDGNYGKDASKVYRTGEFDLPIRKNRAGEYKVPSGEMIYTCFTSDFFLDTADQWREEAWRMIKLRKDLTFFMVTKRIDRFWQAIPNDWGDGYDNVIVCCTVENQRMADYRLPIFLQVPIKHKSIVCEPLLEAIDLTPYLGKNILQVVAGGESGPQARLCDYDWILSLREQCIKRNVSFLFKQTGANFRKDGKVYHIARKYQHIQARKANVNYRERDISI